MNIGLDYISTLSGGGNAVYSRNICERLPCVAPQDSFYYFHYVHDYIRGKKQLSPKPNVRYLPSYVRGFYNRTAVRLASQMSEKFIRHQIKKNSLDLFHFTQPLEYFEVPCTQIVTMHDLSPLHNPEWSKESSRKRLEVRLDAIVTHCAMIIAVSEYTKQDLVKQTGISPEKVAVVYEAASEEFFPELDRVYVKKGFNLENYLVCVGQLQPRKNIVGLLEAYAQIPVRLRSVYKLVLVGTYRDSAYQDKVECVLNKYKLHNNVVVLHSITTAELRKLYSTAHCSVYPSFFEGFGLPVVESIACGTPVITSNSSSLAEIGGEAALHVDPYDTEAITAALYEVIESKDVYQKLKKATMSERTRFSWEKTARETFAVYEEIQKLGS